MKKKRRIAGAAIAAMVGLASSAYAGKEVGNGGDALVCLKPSGKIESVTMYDHYEAAAKYKLTIDLDPKLRTRDEKVALVLDRIARLNPSRAKLYREWFRSFFLEAEFLKDVHLVDIPDTGDGFYPQNCHLEQLAVQRVPKFPGEMRYTVDRNLWDRMSPESQAGLVVHELMLREATTVVRGAQTNSRNARYFNSIASTHALDGMGTKAYHDLLQLVEFDRADAQGGVPIFLPPVGKPLKYHPNGLVRSATGTGEDFDYAWQGNTLPLSGMTALEFSETGVPLEFDFRKGASVSIALYGIPYAFRNAEAMRLDDGGRPSRFTTYPASEFPVSNRSFQGACRAVEFAPTGAISSCDYGYGSLLALNPPLEQQGAFLRFDARGDIDSSQANIFDFAAHLSHYDGTCRVEASSGEGLADLFYPNGSPRECSWAKGRFSFLKNEGVASMDTLALDEGGIITNTSALLEFAGPRNTFVGKCGKAEISNGVLRSCISPSVGAKILHDGRWIPVDYWWQHDGVRFNAAEDVVEASVSSRNEAEVVIPGGMRVFLNDKITFDDAGFARSGMLSRDQVLPVAGAGTRSLPKGKVVTFDSSGLVEGI